MSHEPAANGFTPQIDSDIATSPSELDNQLTRVGYFRLLRPKHPKRKQHAKDLVSPTNDLSIPSPLLFLPVPDSHTIPSRLVFPSTVCLGSANRSHHHPHHHHIAT
jgi:hypothetical protein